MSILQTLEKDIISSTKLQADGIPSASIAILEDGKVTSHVLTTGSENTETVYQACSISKAIASLAVARLVDQGLLSYETKIIDHLSEEVIDSLTDESTLHLLEHVTIAHLLSHTSGFSQHGFPGYPHGAAEPSLEDILSGHAPSNTPRVRFLTFPGMYWKYAGGGYVVLQLILEKVTGQKFSDLMHDLVLQPLKMTRSWYGDLPPEEKNYASSYYTGYTPCENGHHNLIEQAAAGLWTTPTDLLKAAVAVQDSLYNNGDDPKSPIFLTKSTAQKMLTQVASAEHPSIQHMALGWFANDSAFSHTGGNFPGYTSYLFAFHGSSVNANSATPVSANQPLKRSGFAIMTNSAVGHEAGIWQIMGALFHLKNWPAFKTLSPMFGEDKWVPYPAAEGTDVEKGWEEWAGKWEEGWRVVDDDGVPGLTWKEFPAMRLRTAAAPVGEVGQGKKEFLFVVDGLPIRVRLTWHGEERVIEMRQKKEMVLKRSP